MNSSVNPAFEVLTYYCKDLAFFPFVIRQQLLTSKLACTMARKETYQLLTSGKRSLAVFKYLNNAIYALHIWMHIWMDAYTYGCLRHAH